MAIKFGVIGCANNLASRLASTGLEVLHWPVGGKAVVQAGITQVSRIEDYWEEMPEPRAFLLDLPLGAEFDALIDPIAREMNPGDILLDPTCGYWADSLRRYRRMRHRSLYYLDLAILAPGPVLAVGGDDKGFAKAQAVLKLLAPALAGQPAEILHLGSSGFAHYAKMVEEGVACAAAQAASEARQMIEAWPGGMKADSAGGLYAIGDEFAAQSRAPWLLDDALRLEASIPVLAQATMLQLAEALDEHRSEPPLPRMGGFVHPDDIE